MIEILDARMRKSVESDVGYIVISAGNRSGIRLQKSLWDSLGWLESDRVVFGHEKGCYYMGRSNDEYAFHVRSYPNGVGSRHYMINAKTIEDDLVKVLDPQPKQGKYYFKVEPTNLPVKPGSPYYWYRIIPKTFR